MTLLGRERITHDLSLAKELCEKLRSGERKCLDGLFSDYNDLFKNFARRRLFNPDSQEDVVQTFWEELMNAKAICAYTESTERKATLRTYLLGILHHRIIDANRRTSKNKEIHQEGKNLTNQTN